MLFPTLRLRRLREHPTLRDLIRETHISRKDLIYPIFIKGETGPKVPVSTMPGVYQLSLASLDKEIQELVDLKIGSLLLFGIPPEKDPHGSDSFCESGIIQKALRKIKTIAPDLLLFTDICLCEYTDHGHCGFIIDKKLDNDRTLEILAKQAVSHARAGADVVAPSGMIDGMVSTIRSALDQNGFSHIPIFSYSAKYQSCLYGPFRAAAEGAPSFGDRSTHQMDPANAKEALREVSLDLQEGADMIMVKPAHAYLDVIYRVKEAYPHVPLGAYHTSGEYSMIKAAAERGMLDEKKAVLEILRGIRRAGADFILTYYAKEIALWNLF